MKTTNYIQLLLLFSPILVNAQWGAVRFDHSNTFNNAFTVSADTAFFLGTESVNSESFVLRTNNGGTTWDSIGLNLGSTPSSYAYSHFYLNGNIGFVGGVKNNKEVLLKTTNNGTAWTDITPDPNANERIVSIYFIDALTGWASTGWGILYKTINGGSSWTTAASPFPMHDIYFSNANIGFACGELWWQAGAVIAKTVDGGISWNVVLQKQDANLFVSSFDKIDFINQYEGYTKLGGNFYRTMDGGNNWDSIAAPSQFINDFDFTSSAIGHIVSTDGEIFATNDGGQNWTLEYATTWGAYGPSVTLYSLSFIGQTGYVGGTNGLVKKHSSSTGIKDEKQSTNNITIYPNPVITSQNVAIKISEPFENGILQIVNTLGQIVLEKNINAVAGNTTITLSDINFPAGIYYVTIETKENRITEKLIITK